MTSLPPDHVTAVLNAATEYLSKLPACNGNVAVAGFCWGGGQTFRFATNNKAIKAAFVFYGTGPDKADDVGRIAAPVYGFYGGNGARGGGDHSTPIPLMEKGGKSYHPRAREGGEWAVI